MDESSQPKVKYDQREAWLAAQKRLRSSIHFASSFTTTIRTLKQNSAENRANGRESRFYTPASQFLATRLCRANSVLAPLYFITKIYKENRIVGRDYLPASYLMKLYTPDELAAILGLVYVYHRLRKSADSEEWFRYSKVVNGTLEISAQMGILIPEIGFANGLIISGMRLLSAALFMRPDLKKFRDYRRDLKISKKLFNEKMELDRFNCSHVDIATLLIQNLGYGADFAEMYRRSLTTPINKPLPAEANAMRICSIWSEALYVGTKPPSIVGEDEIAVTDEIIDRLLCLGDKLSQSDSQNIWISKTKSAINKRAVPELYPPSGVDAAQLDQAFSTEETEIFILPYQDIPETVKEQLNESEYDTLSAEISELLEESAD